MIRQRKIFLLIGGLLALGLASLGVYLIVWPSWAVANACPAPTKAGDSYTAIDTEGRTFTAHNLLGSPTLLFFGYTYCPEVCPTTIGDISRWLDELGKDADKLKVVFVTVDPERDTPEQLKSYLSSSGGRILGVVAASCDLAVMAKKYQVYYKKVQLEHGEYSVDHNASILLLDSNGQMVGTLNYQEPDNIALAKLRRLAASAK